MWDWLALRDWQLPMLSWSTLFGSLSFLIWALSDSIVSTMLEGPCIALWSTVSAKLSFTAIPAKILDTRVRQSWVLQTSPPTVWSSLTPCRTEELLSQALPSWSTKSWGMIKGLLWGNLLCSSKITRTQAKYLGEEEKEATERHLEEYLIQLFPFVERNYIPERQSDILKVTVMVTVRTLFCLCCPCLWKTL